MKLVPLLAALVPGCSLATNASIGVQEVGVGRHRTATQGRVALGIGEVDSVAPAAGEPGAQSYLEVEASAGWPSRADDQAFQGSFLVGLQHLRYGFDHGWFAGVGAGVRSSGDASGALLQVSGGPLWFLDAHVDPGAAEFRASSIALELSVGAMPEQRDVVLGVGLTVRHDAIAWRARSPGLPPLFR
jgi:hypothetical protein